MTHASVWHRKPWNGVWWMWRKLDDSISESTVRFTWCWVEKPHRSTARIKSSVRASTHQNECRMQVWFYGISTIVGYLMPNPVLAYILDISSSSSSCCATSTNIPDPLSPLLSIVHRFWQVLMAISHILTELLYVSSSWSPCFSSAMCGVHGRTLPMSLSLLLQQCPACLVRLTLIVFVMGGRWSYSCCFVGCCLQDLFKIAHSILV